MKNDFINALISCEWWNTGAKVDKHFALSVSIEDIAEYLEGYMIANGINSISKKHERSE